MAAATTSDTKLLAAHKDKLLGCVRNLVLDEGINCGLSFPFADIFTIPTTSIDDIGDIRRFYLFPGGAYLDDLRVTVNGPLGAALVFSIVVTDALDVVKDTLISASAVGAAGGTARVADTGIGQYVGDRYLAMKIGTPTASPVSQTMGIYVRYSIGINSTQSGGLYPILTDVNV